ncbi:ROK family protein [Rubripirellula lacrimiformis]|nr:ROK family protein [Rubripirellula lacrimiformis]
MQPSSPPDISPRNDLPSADMPALDPPPVATDLFLGIDVGGTNVKVGLVDGSGVLHAKASTATPPLKTPDRVFRYAIDFAIRTMRHWDRPIDDLMAVGLAVPGVLDTREFQLREVVNLPGWLGQPLRDILVDTCQRPAMVVNDANAAAYAEHSLRKLGDQSLALVTLGTGIGAGVVTAGRPHGGDHGCAGEVGHIAIEFGDMALPCTCGSRGHLESYAGAAGVIARLRASMPEDYQTNSDQIDRDQISRDLYAGQPWTPRSIAMAAADGDALCLQIIDQTGDYVGRAIGMLGQTLDPAVVLLGGAMTFGGDQTSTGRGFLERIRRSVTDTTLVQVGGNIQVEFASLGNDAGTLGAAMVAKNLT